MPDQPSDPPKFTDGRGDAGVNTVLDLTSLRTVAEAANADGRPWVWEGGYPQRVLREGDVVIVADCSEDPDHPSRFAEFIATFDPPTVLWLLNLIEVPA